MNTIDEKDNIRLCQLKTWLKQLGDKHALNLESLKQIAGDASFRRYYRIQASNGQQSFIVMDAAPPQEDVRPFMKVAHLFAQMSLTVPQILAENIDEGFLLLSDLGSVHYADLLNSDTAHALYSDAIDSLVLMQTQSQPDVLPEYDRHFLHTELQLFPEWYIGKHLKIELSQSEQTVLQQAFDLILDKVVAQPLVYVHRDYHSRNLMVLQKGNPGIIDFQGALFGPIYYDLASLLRDAYIQWDEELVLDWAIRYWEKAKRAGLPVAMDIDSFYRDFEYVGLQRHLKILGIFARLSYRDGKHQYLNDMPLVIDYVRKVAGRYIELTPLLRLIDKLDNQQAQFAYTF